MSIDPNPADFFDRLISRSTNAAGSLKVRSSLNPMLWLCGIVSPLGFFGAWLLRDAGLLSVFIAAAALLPIAVACAVYVYFAIRKPEHLRSEEYQIKHEALELIREKGKQFAVERSSIEAIANPSAPVGEGR